MDNKSTTVRLSHVTLIIFVAHIVTSHVTGFDFSKAAVAFVLGAIHFAYLHFRIKSIPDFKEELRKEFDAKIVVIKEQHTKDLEKQKADILHSISSEFSKYQALLIKSPTKTLADAQQTVKNIAQTQNYRF